MYSNHSMQSHCSITNLKLFCQWETTASPGVNHSLPYLSLIWCGLHPNALRKAEQGGPRAWISVTEAGKWAGVPSSAFRLVQIQLLYPSRERTNGWKISVSFSVTLPNKRMFKKQDNTSTPLECYNHKVRAQQMLAKTGQKMVQPIWRTASQFFKWLSIKLPRDQQFHSYICMSTKERGTNVHGILFITTRNNSNTHQQMKG